MREPQVATVIRPAQRKRDMMIDVKLALHEPFQADHALTFLKNEKLIDVFDGVTSANRFDAGAAPIPQSNPRLANELWPLVFVVTEPLRFDSGFALLVRCKPFRVSNEPGNAALCDCSFSLSLF